MAHPGSATISSMPTTFRLLAALFIATMLVPAAAQAAPSAYIVVLKAGSDPSLAASRHGAIPSHQYRSALQGYAATLTDAQLARVKADPQVSFVTADLPMQAAGKPAPAQPLQVVPTGIQRIGGMMSVGMGIDGIDNGADVDIAIIDTGIDPNHPDLNVVGGYNCLTGKRWVDGNGHGTHVAGTAAARDNGIGVVGAAPGARLWAVRVLDNQGSGSYSSIICGIDWVTSQAATIEVANMSLGGAGSDDGACGSINADAMHAAVCRSTAAGVLYTVAAGNDNANSITFIPAAYDEVMTVSALADFNGLAGGGAAATCRSDIDDTMANFSNYGFDVDISAPGVCIQSTWMGGGYNTISGTSMASPHVAGAAALYRSLNPAATASQTRDALLVSATAGPIPGDRDGFSEGLLNVAGF